MPLDTQHLIQNKDLIISTLQNRGPSLPVHIARSVNLSILFASAFLSELYGEKRVLMSHMKVGSSSLYYLTGQEAQLENFVQHLNPKEKEAFYLLKKEKLLKDERQEPAIRVALRQLKDFAHPVKITMNAEPQLFWKYFLLSDSETEALAQQLATPEKKAPPQPALVPQAPQEPSPSEEPRTPKEKPQKKPRTSKQSLPRKEITFSLSFTTAPTTQQTPLSLFAQHIQAHLAKKEITLHSIVADKKKEVHAKISVNTPLGPQAFYLIAKDKKRIKEEELIEALQKAHAEKMPALMFSFGDIEKKALPLLQEWSALLKFEKLT